MKKRIFALMIILIVVISNVACVFGAFERKGHSTILLSSDLTLGTCLNYVESDQSTFDMSKYNYFYWRGSHSGRSNCVYLYFISKNDVLVRHQQDGYYTYTCHYLKSDGTLGQGYVPYKCFIEPGYISYYDSGFDSISDSSYVEFETNAPICASEEYALKYFQTMDASYLANSELFVDVPAPHNVRIYKASEENSVYLYYENPVNTLVQPVDTCIQFVYMYDDENGIFNKISEYSEVVEYKESNQYCVSLSPIMDYSTGHVMVTVTNRALMGDKYLLSDSVAADYYWSKKQYSLHVYDTDTGETIESNVFDISDFGTQNDDFNGGDSPTGDMSDIYMDDSSFIDFIGNGFGLIGDNGVIALMGNLFSYIPFEHFKLVEYGLMLTISIGLFKLAFK